MDTTAPSFTQSQLSFFGYLFGEQEGYLCLATANPQTSKTDLRHFQQQFFFWPKDKEHVIRFLESDTIGRDTYFCTSLLTQTRRAKETCIPSNLVWADLDTCDPETVEPAPSIVIQSSKNKYQALWRCDRELSLMQQEEYSKLIAYRYRVVGADVTGWDLTQLLRVPYTYNFKYNTTSGPHQVEILKAFDAKVPFDLLDGMEPLDDDYEPSIFYRAKTTLPNPDHLPEVESVLYKHLSSIEGTSFGVVFRTVPDDLDSWSDILWKFLNMCFEFGMDEFEVYALAREAGCNKYKRDGRPDADLWADVIRAADNQQKGVFGVGVKTRLSMPDIVQGMDTSEVSTFIDDYYAWATEATDAVPEFHELCGFMILSAIMAAGLIVKPSYKPDGMHPNLWGLILGDSTLTRKSTAMSMAMNLVTEVDNYLILASDGSVEGILTGLAERPNRTSVFFRDEVTGFFSMVNRKDYLSGITETFTHLYDVPKVYPRRLRKETITVKSPVFIFFAGGIRDRVHTCLDEESILSGFLPRFLVVTGESDIRRIRRSGPLIMDLSDQKDKLYRSLTNYYERFNRTAVLKLGGEEIVVPQTVEAILTPEAWELYADIEEIMIEAANKTPQRDMALPTFDRMSKSMLKMSLLLAASDTKNPTGQDKGEKLTVTDLHVGKAASYAQRWGNNAIDLMLSVGKSKSEVILSKVMGTIERYPRIMKGQLMRIHSLTSREANEILSTLEERGYIKITRMGRGQRIEAV